MAKKNEGKVFEDCFKKSINKVEGTYYLRIKDNPASFANQKNQFGSKTTFSTKNDYDCIAYQEPYLLPMELKSTKGTSFSFAENKDDEGKMVHFHQLVGLRKASEVDGVYGGFIFNFREKQNRTYWMYIGDFARFMSDTTKKSVNENDMIEYGAIELKSTLKRVNYSYHVDELIQDIKIYIGDMRQRNSDMIKINAKIELESKPKKKKKTK